MRKGLKNSFILKYLAIPLYIIQSIIIIGVRGVDIMSVSISYVLLIILILEVSHNSAFVFSKNIIARV